MTDYHPEFERDYDQFPERDGQRRGKYDAYKKWLKLRVAERELMHLDIEKRNRQNGWGKYIPDISRYVNQRMWEEDWKPYEPSSDCKSDKPNSGTVRYVPREDVLPDMTWPDIVLGRVFACYVAYTTRAVPADQIEKALEIKAELLSQHVPALQEELDADELTVHEASQQLAGAMLKRLDKAYGRRDADRVMTAMNRATPPWKRQTDPRDAIA